MRCCTVATGHEEQSRDLLGREARDDAQGEGDLRFTREHGVAGGEHESDDVVVDRLPLVSSAVSDRSWAIARYRSSRRSRRRQPSIALRFATAVSQAPAFCGTPDSGHCVSASTSASCARSSARPTSPVILASVATMRALSMRQTASTVRWMSVTMSPGERPSQRPSRRAELARLASLTYSLSAKSAKSSLLGDAAHLELGARPERSAARPLDGFLLARDLEDPEPVEQLVRLAVGAVGHDRLLAGEIDDESLGRRARPSPASRRPP